MVKVSDDNADEVLDAVESQVVGVVADALKAVADQAVLDTRTLIAVQVERSGKTKIRSKPGENPRRETGRLFSEIQATDVEQSGENTLEVSVISPTSYSAVLHDKLDRQFLVDRGGKAETTESIYRGGKAMNVIMNFISRLAKGK